MHKKYSNDIGKKVKQLKTGHKGCNQKKLWDEIDESRAGKAVISQAMVKRRVEYFPNKPHKLQYGVVNDRLTPRTICLYIHTHTHVQNVYDSDCR